MIEPVVAEVHPAPSGSVDMAEVNELKSRIAYVWREKWIDYPIADQALKILEDLLDQPDTHRPQSRLLVGDTNNGKTAIAIEFEDRVREGLIGRVDPTEYPVIRVQAPPEGTLSGLYGAILRHINAPARPSFNKERKRGLVLDQLSEADTKMLIIDEIQHALLGGADDQRELLHGIKHLSNELRIPVVVIGTDAARSAVHTDQQIGNRLEAFEIPKWRPDETYAMFLHQLGLAMGLEKPSNLRNGKLVLRFHAMTKGLTGETRKLMCRAAEQAITSGREIIDLETLDEIEWVNPDDRRN